MVRRPVEIHQLHIRPSDFFTANPALDVPSTKNQASVLVTMGSQMAATNLWYCVLYSAVRAPEAGHALLPSSGLTTSTHWLQRFGGGRDDFAPYARPISTPFRFQVLVRNTGQGNIL